MKFHRNTLTLEKDGSTRFSEWRTGYSCQTCPDFEVNFVRQSCLYPYIAHRHTHRAGPGLPRGKKDQLNCASSSMAPEFWGGWLIHVRRFELVERKINLLLPSIKPCKSPGNFIIASNQIIINFKLIRDFPTHIFCLAAAAVAHSHLWSVRLRFVLRGWQVAVLVLEEISSERKKGFKNRLLSPEYCYDKASSMSRPLTSPFSPAPTSLRIKFLTKTPPPW